MEVIDTVPIEELDFWEEHYIFLYRSWGFDLVNIMLDVVQCRMSNDTKKKMSQRLYGNWNNQEYRERQSAAIRKGINANLDNIKAILRETSKRTWSRPELIEKRKENQRKAISTESYKQTMRKISKENWNNLSAKEKEVIINRLRSNVEKRNAAVLKVVTSEEYRQNHSKLAKERMKRPFVVFTKGGEVVGEWENVVTCANDLKLYSSHLSSVLSGRLKSTGGYVAKHKTITSFPLTKK